MILADGGRHDDGHVAEAEEHDRAVRRGERPELSVGQRAKKRQVAGRQTRARLWGHAAEATAGRLGRKGAQNF